MALVTSFKLWKEPCTVPPSKYNMMPSAQHLLVLVGRHVCLVWLPSRHTDCLKFHCPPVFHHKHSHRLHGGDYNWHTPPHIPWSRVLYKPGYSSGMDRCLLCCCCWRHTASHTLYLLNSSELFLCDKSSKVELLSLRMCPFMHSLDKSSRSAC